MIKLHFESVNRKDLEEINYEWSKLFVGSKAYVDSDIVVTSIYKDKIPTETGEESIQMYCFDVVFCIDAFDSVTNEVKTIHFNVRKS